MAINYRIYVAMFTLALAPGQLVTEESIYKGSNGHCTNGTIQLSPEKNFVQYCINDQWRTLCAGGGTWTRVEANVICTQLGMSSSGATRDSNEAGNNDGAFFRFGDQSCRGGESNLRECTNINMSITECTQNKGTVKCQPANCNHGDVRLMGGASIREGRVDTCFTGQWATVCNTRPDMAGPVCNKLGFLAEGATQTNASLSIDHKVTCSVNGCTLNCNSVPTIVPCVSGSLEVQCPRQDCTTVTSNSSVTAALGALVGLLMLLEIATVIGALLYIVKTKRQSQPRVLVQSNESYTSVPPAQPNYSTDGPQYDELDRKVPPKIAPYQPDHPPPVGGVSEDQFYNAEAHTYAAVNKK